MAAMPKISLWKMILCLSEASDLINPLVVRHQKRVAYIVSCLAQELNLEAHERDHVVMAAALHDVGVFSLHERMETLKFDYVEGIVPHSVTGYSLLKSFSPLSEAAELILYHHYPWNKRDKVADDLLPQLRLAGLIYLADRVDILIDYQKEILSQEGDVRDKIVQQSGTLFAPEVVTAFLAVARRESFWFDLCSDGISNLLPSGSELTVALDSKQLQSLAQLFSRVIDFRSRYTALHSGGVATCASSLAEKLGMSAQECQMMSLAGYLHDIGKVAVSKEILEKPGKLSVEEYAQVKRHTYFSYHLLKQIPELEIINEWISFHHECPSGDGYPFHVEAHDLSLGARIVAVADVFSAITEPRPYRNVMEYRQAKQVLDEMVANRRLDAEVVAVLLDNFYQFFERNVEARRAARKDYALFDQQVKWLLAEC